MPVLPAAASVLEASSPAARVGPVAVDEPVAVQAAVAVVVHVHRLIEAVGAVDHDAAAGPGLVGSLGPGGGWRVIVGVAAGLVVDVEHATVGLE